MSSASAPRQVQVLQSAEANPVDGAPGAGPGLDRAAVRGGLGGRTQAGPLMHRLAARPIGSDRRQHWKTAGRLGRPLWSGRCPVCANKRSIRRRSDEAPREYELLRRSIAMMSRKPSPTSARRRSSCSRAGVDPSRARPTQAGPGSWWPMEPVEHSASRERRWSFAERAPSLPPPCLRDRYSGSLAVAMANAVRTTSMVNPRMRPPA